MKMATKTQAPATRTEVSYRRVRLDTLKGDPHNPRKMKPKARAALAASINRFGLVQPIIVNEVTGNVVGGHQRITVLLDQGAVEADVAFGSWTPDEERALNVALNNPKAQGEFTGDVGDYLASALSSFSADDFEALEFTGLMKQPDEVSVIIEEIETSAVTDEFWITVRGPLAGQADVLELLRDAIGKVDGVMVKIGTVKR
jgi:hypothetical protein